MTLKCTNCISRGYCIKRCVPWIDDKTLRNPYFLIDLKRFLVNYSLAAGVKQSQWHDHIVGLYRDYPGWVRLPGNREAFLDTECYEDEFIREWFRGFIQLVPDGALPRLREETKERVRTLAVMMRAYFPEETMMFGVRAANDN